MSQSSKISGDFDFLTAFLYFLCIVWGLINIFAAVYQPENTPNMLDLSLNSTRQLIFIGVAFIAIIVVMTVNYRIYETFAYIIYAFTLLLLLSVLVIGTEVNGAKAWFRIGSVGFQPAEIAKYATALVLARFLANTNVKMESFSTKLIAIGIITLPTLLILMQPDLGSVMVYASFIFVLYREGLPHWMLILIFTIVLLFVLTLLVSKIYLILVILTIALIIILIFRSYFKSTNSAIISIVIGAAISILFVFSVDYFINNVLKGYQRERILVLINSDTQKKNDEMRLRAGWNVTQSKIAIGSGGMWGKGFLGGTQTKLKFVPEQSTDFIFCTIGEEYGWIGSLFTIALFLALIYRIILIAERQRDGFVRIYGYGVASIIFLHFTINIAMTIGLFPVVGIPLPFFSYGGSSLISFTVLLFTLLKLDAHRGEMLARS